MPTAESYPPRPTYSVWAGFLSYLVPGLGQIVQGRVGKGLLFLVCLYGLFFYGMHLGQWSNVYLPRSPHQGPWVWRQALNVWDRLQFAGQFWIGAAAWPALWQYSQYDSLAPTGPVLGDFMRAPPEDRRDVPVGWQGKTLNELQVEGDKTWDLGWVFTVIAGVLNVLVIYDAYAGPAFAESERAARKEPT